MPRSRNLQGFNNGTSPLLESLSGAAVQEPDALGRRVCNGSRLCENTFRVENPPSIDSSNCRSGPLSLIEAHRDPKAFFHERVQARVLTQPRSIAARRLSLSTVIPGLVPGTPLSAAGAGGAVRQRFAGEPVALHGRAEPGSGHKARNDGCFRGFEGLARGGRGSDRRSLHKKKPSLRQGSEGRGATCEVGWGR
jgi:hypothetical protein